MTVDALWQLGPFELTVRLWFSIGRRRHQSWGKTRPLSSSRNGKKSLKSYGAVSRKLCHVVHRKGGSYWTTESQATPIFWRIPSLIGSISHPRIVVCAFTVLPFSVSVYVHSASLLLRGGKYDYGKGVVYVRSDKDSELETYGEGIKKEIQYRRTLYLLDQLFRLVHCYRATLKTLKFSRDKGRFWLSPKTQNSL